MKVVVTGATGFVGRHVVPALLSKGHRVIVIARHLNKAKEMPWYDQVNFVACDIHDSKLEPLKIFGVPDAMIHLAWPGLPNYNDMFHIEKNFPADCIFLEKIISSGIKHVLVTGTCLEYGMQSGALSEETDPAPTTPYGLAKNNLRKFLQDLQIKHPFTLQWVRLFYMYGYGQNPKSLLAQLDIAIENKAEVFNMSKGEQLRDYMPVQEVAHCLVSLLGHPQCSGIINCCSGKPISVRKLVEQRIAQRGAKIKLNLGYYPYADYEPKEFWGDNTKFRNFGDNPCH